jgi:hypothetical protein
VADAELYAPSRGPERLADWQRLPAPATPVPAVVYVPGCSTDLAQRDHVPFLQSQGVAVVVPTLDDAGCAHPEAPFNVMHAEISAIAVRLAEIPWIDPGRLYLMGHAVGSDVATTYPPAGDFAGVVALAAACPMGVQDAVPTLTFRALDDPVLANRGTRCAEYDSPNSLHLEFAGSDHVMRLQPGAGPSDARALVRRAVIAFLGVSEGPAAPTIADADAGDLRQIGVAPASVPAAAAPTATPAPIRDVPAFEPSLLPQAAPAVASPAPVSEPAPTAIEGPRTPEGEPIFLPSLRLPMPSF